MGRWDGHVKTQKKCSNPNCTVLVWKGTYCSKCRQRLSRHGSVDIVLPKHRIYFFNEKLLDVWTKESAWILGWLITDGCVSQGTLGIVFKLKDKEPLDIMKGLFQHTANLDSLIWKDKQYWQLRLHSVYLYNRVYQLGITPAKSLTIGCPQNIPSEVQSHFVRGVVEGDGSIIYSNGQYLRIHINSASLTFIDGLEKLIPFKGCKFAQTKNRQHALWRLVYSGQAAKEFGNWIYQDSEGLRLTRKYDKFISGGR